MSIPYDQFNDHDPERPYYPEITVPLSGEDGNGFFIIGRTRSALRKHGVSHEEIEKFQTEAMSGDYENLLSTVQRWVRVS